MAERLDDVLAELMASQEVAPEAEPAEAQPTEPAPAEGGENAPEGEMTGESTPAPASEEKVGTEGGEVPSTPAPDPQMEAVARTAQIVDGQQAEIAQLREALQQMQQMTAQTQQAAQEANRRNEEAIADVVLKPPVLDLNAVQYLGEEERKHAIEQYGSAMADYAKQSIMKDLQPMVDHFKRQTKEAEDARVRNVLGGVGGLEGFNDSLEQIENIIAKTPALTNLPPETRYALGYVINRGVQAMNAKPAEPEGVESLVARVLENPEAMKAIEKERVARIAAANRQAPPVAASQGQSNAPAVAQNAPQDFNEARARARKIFGL